MVKRYGATIRGHVRVSYPAWKPEFYPKDVPAKKFLEYYATRLNSVEVDYTSRVCPRLRHSRAGSTATPGEFAFACKAHMRLTHIMKMKDAGSFTEVFLKALEPLRSPAPGTGPLQFPPTFKCDLTRLDEYLPLLPNDVRFAFEFRHASWLTDEVYERLAKSNIALCLAESDKLEVPKVFTADFGYSACEKGTTEKSAGTVHRGPGARTTEWRSRRIRLLQARGRSSRCPVGRGTDPRYAIADRM